MQRKQSLANWIAEAVLDSEKGSKCTRIALVHMQGVTEKPIYVHKLPEKTSDELFESLGEIFENKADNYADGLPGHQTFQLLAFYGDRPKPDASKPFGVSGYTQMEGLMTEGPTSTGFMQQMMRLMEGLTRTYVNKDAILFDTALRQNESLAKENIALRRENLEAVTFMKEFLLSQATNQHELRMKELAFQRESDERKMLFQTAPSLLNTMLGREVVPQPTADTGMLEGILDLVMKLGPAEAGPLLAKLNPPPPMLMALTARMKRLTENKENEIKARAPLTNGIDPEDDVVGGTH